jgi:hypothetical protein
MTHSEAIAALRLIVDRADQEVASRHGFKWTPIRPDELVKAQAALDVLDRSVIR